MASLAYLLAHGHGFLRKLRAQIKKLKEYIVNIIKVKKSFTLRGNTDTKVYFCI